MSNDVVKSAPIDFTGMLAVAEQLVPTGFLPKHITTAGQCVAIILAGRELGMEPMLALRSITMVQGKIVVAADAQLSLFKSRGGRATFTTLTDHAAILVLRHPNGDEHTETFSIEDAKRAGLTKNPTWTNYPKAMLRSRCITAGLKSIGFEPTAGAYDPEEAASFTETPSGGSVTMLPPGLVQAALTEGKPAESDIPEFRTFLMPFGKSKGKRLMDMEDENLGGALDWASSKGKFEDFQAAGEKEMEYRSFPEALEDQPDDLPFAEVEG